MDINDIYQSEEYKECQRKIEKIKEEQTQGCRDLLARCVHSYILIADQSIKSIDRQVAIRDVSRDLLESNVWDKILMFFGWKKSIFSIVKFKNPKGFIRYIDEREEFINYLKNELQEDLWLLETLAEVTKKIDAGKLLGFEEITRYYNICKKVGNNIRSAQIFPNDCYAFI